ncbi:MAG TPA: hypothetical protein VK420_13135, partial [Longimicrobium sp.]|nr:hypothetical protein [Longimicrobium sp.]
REVPGYASRCLASQLGRAAARNSCRGPWTQTLDATLSYNNLRGSFGRRVTASLFLANLPGAADQLLHGSGGLRGWGTQPTPDPVLYTVRGFNPTDRSFRYEINPRFGEPRSTLSAFGSPFRVTLDVRVNIGKGQDRQAAERIVRVARTFADSQSVRPDEMKKLAFPGRQVGNAEQVLNMREQLALTAEQVTALTAIQNADNERADSLKMDFAQQIARAGNTAEVNWIIAGRRRVEDAIWASFKEGLPRVREVLTAPQIELLPPHLRGEGGEMRMITTQQPRRP